VKTGLCTAGQDILARGDQNRYETRNDKYLSQSKEYLQKTFLFFRDNYKQKGIHPFFPRNKGSYNSSLFSQVYEYSRIRIWFWG
jgi:hypothetical protein